MTDQEIMDLQSAARDQMRAAEEKMHSAISTLRSASQRYMHAEARATDKDERQAVLISHAYSNRSTWSGGVLSASNMIEMAKREAALDLLQRMPHDIR
jgi:hypothetical protein